MSAGGRVLVVDDDQSIREAMELALADEGYEVQVASDGASALTLLEQWRPDVILLDMKMAGMDGWRFAETYRRQQEPRASVIVLTASPNAEGWAAEIAADGLLPKPFDLGDLLDMVRRHSRQGSH